MKSSGIWRYRVYREPNKEMMQKVNAVNRLFILPEYQSCGYGSQLMDFAENKIAERFTHVHIDSSLAAKEMYLKRGYKEKKTCRILADNDDILIYDEMEKWMAI